MDMRLTAGSAYGETLPVETTSPMLYLDVHMDAGVTLDITNEYAERAVYIVAGDIQLDGTSYGENEMLVLNPDADIDVTASSGTRFMLLGGDPIDGERHIWWNFVSSSKERIEHAKDDWKSGRFGTIDGDDEFIPLPEK